MFRFVQHFRDLVFSRWGRYMYIAGVFAIAGGFALIQAGDKATAGARQRAIAELESLSTQEGAEVLTNLHREKTASARIGFFTDLILEAPRLSGEDVDGSVLSVTRIGKQLYASGYRGAAFRSGGYISARNGETWESRDLPGIDRPNSIIPFFDHFLIPVRFAILLRDTVFILNRDFSLGKDEKLSASSACVFKDHLYITTTGLDTRKGFAYRSPVEIFRLDSKLLRTRITNPRAWYVQECLADQETLYFLGNELPGPGEKSKPTGSLTRVTAEGKTEDISLPEFSTFSSACIHPLGLVLAGYSFSHSQEHETPRIAFWDKSSKTRTTNGKDFFGLKYIRSLACDTDQVYVTGQDHDSMDILLSLRVRDFEELGRRILGKQTYMAVTRIGDEFYVHGEGPAGGSLHTFDKNLNLSRNLFFLPVDWKKVFEKNQIDVSFRTDRASVLVTLTFFILTALTGYFLLFEGSHFTKSGTVPSEGLKISAEPAELLENSVSEAKQVMQSMRNNAYILLIAGVAIAGLGLALFYVSIREIPEVTTTAAALQHYIRPVAMLVFVEALAMFFLRQYRNVFSRYWNYYRVYLQNYNTLVAFRLLGASAENETGWKGFFAGLLSTRGLDGLDQGPDGPVAEEGLLAEMIKKAGNLLR